MGPGDLAQVLGHLTQHSHPNLIAGLGPGDDAAVYLVNPNQALVQTLDFFPPIVDDPYTYGAIAAANSMSDVFAMGGEVALALNIVAFPEDLDKSILSTILEGGSDKVREAGGIIAGGHTVTDKEPKYGLCVTGFAEPHQIMRKEGARVSDRLFLTKRIGTGVITTAARNGRADAGHLEAAVSSMLKLNAPASRVFKWSGVRACTDITGFGLLGHASEMAEASGVCLRIKASDVPMLEGAVGYVRDKQVPGGTGRNRDFLLSDEGREARVEVGSGVSREVMNLLFDPQTSGGLLAAVPSDRSDAVRDALEAQGVECWEIGEAVEGHGIQVV